MKSNKAFAELFIECDTSCMYSVYILLCVDGTLYAGITTDVARRFAEHKSGKGGHYTRAHKPKRMVYTEEAEDRSQASKREAAIKRLSRSEKLRLIGKKIS